MVGMVGLAKNPSAKVDSKVSWTIQKFIEIKIDKPAFDFGKIAAGVDEVTKENANTLFVYSNTNWELSFSVSGTGSDHLSVGLSTKHGKGNADVKVGYTLNDLRTMNPGNYTATVTYTVTAK
jgi:hypothetical protein